MASKDELFELVERLREDYDHAFLTVEGALAFSRPFGFDAETYVAYANPDDPKGLTLNDGSASAEGIAADVLARQICDHVGVKYPPMFGRGSQLRACCDALASWLATKKEA